MPIHSDPMHRVYHDLADRALALLSQSQSYRIIIVLIGAPGSGKTTVAQHVADILNQRCAKHGRVLHTQNGEPNTEHLSRSDYSLENLCKDMRNSTLPTHSHHSFGHSHSHSHADGIDYEDEYYTPTVEKLNKTDVIIRGRGGDDTAIRITHDNCKKGHYSYNRYNSPNSGAPRGAPRDAYISDDIMDNDIMSDDYVSQAVSQARGAIGDSYFSGSRDVMGDGYNFYGHEYPSTADSANVSTGQYAQVVSMDGFHLPRRVLAEFKDPERAFRRRGSPYTFDSSLIVKLVENLNKTVQIKVEDNFSEYDIIPNLLPKFEIPNFNHSEKDPRQFGTTIDPGSRIIIMEGLYLLLNNPVWCDIAKILYSDVQTEEEDKRLYRDNSLVNFPMMAMAITKQRALMSKHIHHHHHHHHHHHVSRGRCQHHRLVTCGEYGGGGGGGIGDDSDESSPDVSDYDSDLVPKSAGSHLSVSRMIELNRGIKSVPIRQGQTTEFWKLIITDAKILNRVGKRHLKSKIVMNLKDGEERVKVNDLPNGQKVNNESFKSHLNIYSIDDRSEGV